MLVKQEKKEINLLECPLVHAVHVLRIEGVESAPELADLEHGLAVPDGVAVAVRNREEPREPVPLPVCVVSEGGRHSFWRRREHN